MEDSSLAKQIEGVYEAILACAKREFLEKGYKDASLRTIAREANTSTGSIYTRFRDKEGLFKAVVEPAVEEMRLDELEAEKKKLELAIAEETLEHPDVPKEYFGHWLRHFRSGDVDDPEYRKLLVDIFVNAIYVTDDGLRFALNFFDGVETIPLREWDQAKGSDLLGCAPPVDRIRVHFDE